MKKIWSILLAGLLCIGLLAGCAPAEQPETGSVTDVAVTESVQPTVTASTSVSPSSEVTAPPSAGGSAQETGEPPAASASVSAKGKTAESPVTQGGTGDHAENGATSAPAPAKTPETPPPKTITCTISIDCATALSGNPDLVNAVSSGGTILGGKKVTLDPGATVYDALKATGITFSGKSYISSINSLSEGDCGSQSGWMYSVNGDYPGIGCNKYTLSDGDSIKWRYTCDMGADIGA
ncbi:MAG: DUF4430 domain-containing protein [Christensenella sp.]|uniref:DUF4430 domain-containing protein n=1 Tax=Christensenella sp. TaxID=1935934 RepID=UPI002B1F25F6|nr:DUF4430 domain-containing protein [Christensenella sp.]MEA5004412.1 DUF4430 domain-containing protein [Christensenella sp.]